MDHDNHREQQDMTVRRKVTLVHGGCMPEEPVERELLREHRLEIVVNEQVAARLICTPVDLENLVVGRLITEGIIRNVSEIQRLYLCESGNRARVFLNTAVNLSAAQGEEATCCTDNRTLLQAAGEGDGRPWRPACKRPKADVWRPEWVFAMANAFAEDFQLHRRTGGIHGCMLGVEGDVRYRTEDIGRHNAMDKAIGYGARAGLAPESCMLFTTGRVPTDMVRKAVAAGIPVLISKAVPTKEAVEMAEEHGLTLICRAWPDSFEVYAG